MCRWRTLSLILIDLLPPVSPHPFPPVSSLFLSLAFQAAPTGCSVSVDQRDCFFSRLSSLKTPTFPALSRRLIAFVLYLSFCGWEHCLWVIFLILILVWFKRRLSFSEVQDFGIFLVGYLYRLKLIIRRTVISKKYDEKIEKVVCRCEEKRTSDKLEFVDFQSSSVWWYMEKLYAQIYEWCIYSI